MNKRSFTPPSNWAQLFARLEDYRKHLKAPVDTMGCHRLRDETAPKEVQRFHTLVALMLSAQTKDVVTAAAMDTLIKRELTVQSVHAMTETELDKHICKVGFHNTKARNIKEVAAILMKNYDGKVPREYAELIALPGVGPKMANLFFQDADHRVIGIGVDTHVHRISQRYRWVPSTVKTPEDTRKALESWLPREHWGTINSLMVGLGQTVCTPLRPKCDICELSDICPNAFKERRQKRLRAKAPLMEKEEPVSHRKRR
ncbi:putative endonuclease III [Leishmania major strain Friedlin]|uniref:Endonuclease III homolog n=1 Tax=Leishmania major TaxID=5664 RepID=Q4QI30_LEIMA|nr:putative endonuclease III [Leishmania major strain Friedlin]CAG9569566.1 endonuclease_III-__putative [Leishmania major strain Friedlin]CAJ02303.1 putative endonuclease III [Leishmania major strain Friedlin]|eukprot:XP_001681168.1 putative endonuclease III [Leishmania major strain Friedlin]